MSKVGLLGTRFVMEEDFYRESFCTHGIDVLVPDEEGKNSVHNIIYSELCLGNIVPQSKDVVCRMILNLRRSGAEAVVLGCTELPLLITVEDTPVRLFDTLALHVSKAVDLALEG
jgi:aspartate racemase